MSPVLEEPLWASGSWVTLLSGETSGEASGGTVWGTGRGRKEGLQSQSVHVWLCQSSKQYCPRSEEVRQRKCVSAEPTLPDVLFLFCLLWPSMVVVVVVVVVNI